MNTELYALIFSYLNPIDICNVKLTCKFFNKIINSEQFQTIYIYHEFYECLKLISEPTKNCNWLLLLHEIGEIRTNAKEPLQLLIFFAHYFLDDELINYFETKNIFNPNAFEGLCASKCGKKIIKYISKHHDPIKNQNVNKICINNLVSTDNIKVIQYILDDDKFRYIFNKMLYYACKYNKIDIINLILNKISKYLSSKSIITYSIRSYMDKNVLKLLFEAGGYVHTRQMLQFCQTNDTDLILYVSKYYNNFNEDNIPTYYALAFLYNNETLMDYFENMIDINYGVSLHSIRYYLCIDKNSEFIDRIRLLAKKIDKPIKSTLVILVYYDLYDIAKELSIKVIENYINDINDLVTKKE